MKRNRKQKRSWKSYAIIISLVILAIPTAFLAVTGIKSMIGRGEPQVGSRFKNDLDPKISDKQLEILKETLSDLGEINVSLKTATLRIYVKDESISKENLEEKLKIVYDNTVEILDEEKYFTAKGVQKQYDLEIHGFNDKEDEAYVYGILNKNSKMTNPVYQLFTEPRSEEIVEYFYDQEASLKEEKDIDYIEEIEVEGEE